MKKKINFILGVISGFCITITIWIFKDQIPDQLRYKITENRLNFTCKIDKYFNYDFKMVGDCVGGKFVKRNNQIKLLEIYEEEFLNNLYLPERSIFETLLADKDDIELILGTNNLKYKNFVCKNFNNILNECFLYYEKLPPVKFFISKEEKENIAILLHGHSSSAKHTLGMTEEKDYMRSIGKYLLNNNLGVISMELTSSMKTGKKINDLLLFYGTTLYGLYAKSICIIAQEFKNKNIYLYGLSNGGMIALYSANICKQKNIKHIFIDDIFQNWFNTWGNTIKSNNITTQTYGYTFQKNFYYNFTDIVLLINSKYKLFLSKEKLSDFGELDRCFVKNGDGKLLFFEKKIKKHVAESELFLNTINNNNNKFYSIQKNCLVNNVKSFKNNN